MLITVAIRMIKAARLCRTEWAWQGPRLRRQPPSQTRPSQALPVPEGRGDAQSGPEAAVWGQLSFADEEKVPVHKGSRAKQASRLRTGPPTVGWGPTENGSQALGLSRGSCSTWGRVFHVFLYHHLLPG